MGEPPKFVIVMGDNFEFAIEPDVARSTFTPSYSSDGDLNGRFETRLAAVDSVILDFEQTRSELAAQIARAKRMRRRIAACKDNPNG